MTQASGKSIKGTIEPASVGNSAVAIIGMAFRFPGNLCDAKSMWNALEKGKLCITQVPENRWPIAELTHSERSEPGRSVTFSAGTLSDIDLFDAAFFGISPREVAWMDPQQRLLLEMAYGAIEDSGLRPSSLAGSRCAVYVGISSLDYGLYGLQDLASMSAHSMTGNTLSIAANRLSYFFDLRGPSVAVDTACSSSLVALHYACAALRSGEIPLALAAGVNVLMHPYSFVGFSKASMLSAKGCCRPFDAAGDGYVRAEGGAVLLLKPLPDALRDGDPIHAVILASGVNTDGRRKSGLTIPSADAQAELMSEVLGQSGLSPAQVDFIEAHGTGTPVGDPVEALAIGRVYGIGRAAPMPISSVKATLGHLEPASGMAGLVKAVLSLQHGYLPPMPLEYTPNPHIDFQGLNVTCAATGMPLHTGDSAPLAAGVNSFGFGGVNAHVLLQAMDAQDHRQADTAPVPQAGSMPPVLSALPPLLLSAHSEESLRALAEAYADRIEQADARAYYDVAYTVAFFRDRKEKRLAILENTPAAGAAALRAYAEGVASSHGLRENAPADGEGIAFIYSGNGAQWVGMGHELLQQSPRFVAILRELDSEMRALAGFSALETLQQICAADLQDTTLSQPLLFVIQVGLTLLLREYGVTPQAVAGHSVGEIAAAWAAGLLDLPNAIRVIHARSQAQGRTRGAGRMAAVAMSAASIEKYLHALHIADTVEIAGVNSPNNVTLSGDPASLDKLHAQLPQNIFFRQLDLDYAFHSRHMDAIRPVLADKLCGLNAADTASKEFSAIFVSTVTGKKLKKDRLNSEYWWNNVRQPVRFADAVQELARLGCRIFVEVGPHAILQRYIRESLNPTGVKGRILSTLLRGDEGSERMDRVAARLHLLSGHCDLRALFPHEGARVPLPAYPWQKTSYWHPRTCECQYECRRVHPLLGWPLLGESASSGSCLVWENILHPSVQPWLAEHKVGGATVFPGAGYAEMALAAAQAWLGDENVAFESLDIFIPLVFDDSRAQSVRCSLDPTNGSLRICSRPRLNTGEWVQHASARLVTADRVPRQRMEPLAATARIMDKNTLYALTTSLELDYGPTFRVVEEIRTDGHRLDAMLAPVDSIAHGFVLHPAALDACFHALVSFYAQDNDSLNTAFLPVKTGHVQCFAAGAVTCVRAVVRRSGLRSLSADFELLDAQGGLLATARDCRFRAVPLARAAQQQVDAWRIVPWLSPRIKTCIPLDAPSPQHLAQHLTRCFSEDIASRRPWFRRTLPLLEAMVLSFAMRAFHSLWACNAPDGAPWQPSSPYARWLVQLLQREGLLLEKSGQYTLCGGEDLPPAEELWREALAQASQCLPPLLAVGRIGRQLKDVLQGSMDGVELFEAVRHAPVATENRFVDPACEGVRAAIHESLRELARQWPIHRQLRVLEIAAVPIGLTATLEAVLPKDRFVHVQALGDTEAQSLARKRYGNHASVHVVPFDASAWKFEGLPAGPFDVVIVDNVLHKTVDLGAALTRTRALLTSGGLLLAAERHADWSADFVEGLNPDWWQGDVQSAPQSSLLAPQSWLHLLEEYAFISPCVYTEPAAEDLAEGAYLLLAAGSSAVMPEQETPRASWLLLADATTNSLAQALGESLRANGQEVECRTMDTHCGDMPPILAEHVVFMGGASDAPSSTTSTLERLRLCALACSQQEPHPSRLWVITQGGALATRLPEEYRPHPAQCAVWGMARVIMNEHSELRCTLVDVSPDAAQNAARLAEELLHPESNDEIVLTANARYVLRLDREDMACSASTEAVSEERCKLDFAVPGRLRNLAWSPAPERPLRPDEVEARVMNTGLNFRDVMLTMGLLPDDAVEKGFAGATLGLEFAGIVTRVGSLVHDLSPGQRVVGFAPACFTSHVQTPAHAVAPIPEHWTFAEAATIPTVFFTAWYALKYLAQIRPGERVLIHGAAGGVGLAAIQVARHLGATVYATAGSEEKRDLLRLLGVEHIFDSRSLSFAADLMAATEEAGDGTEPGVDVVLNSLAKEAMRRSVGLLRPFGRFLELGKRDFVENTSLGLRLFKENISYFAIDADQLLTARPGLASELFSEVMQLLRAGTFHPLPHCIFPAQKAEAAFRAMQQAKHMGKIVVDMAQLPVLPRSEDARPAIQEGREGTWLITGGLSGFGLSTARQLVQLGVKHLVLVGRRGAQTPDAEKILAEFTAAGAHVCAEACDVADADAVHALVARVQENMPPLKGVVHAAAHFDDRILARLDAASLEAVLAPKLTGAWNLHEATLNADLEHFVLYSSISTALGNPGQGNYVAANAGLEGLAHYRERMGLPATCIAWGPLGDVGYLTRHDAVKQSLSQRLGREPLTVAQATAQLENLMRKGKAGNPVCILAPVDWSAVAAMLPSGGAARFRHVFRDMERRSRAQDGQDIQQILKSANPEQIMDTVRRLITEEVAQVLALSAEQVAADKSLQSMGMDSLMAVELAVALEQRMGVRLPAMMLQDSPSVEQIAVRVATRLCGSPCEGEEKSMATALARQHAETLSEEETAAMIGSAAAQGARS